MWLCTGTRTLNRYQIIHISYVSEPPSDRTLYSYSILNSANSKLRKIYIFIVLRGIKASQPGHLS